MAEGVISFPFRLNTDGTVATVGHGTDAEVDEAIATLVLTKIGERPMSPEYGIPDPAFTGLFIGDVQVGLDDYGPAGVLVTSVDSVPVTDTMMRTNIEWTRTDGDARDD